jgi:hypothetical protein
MGLTYDTGALIAAERNVRRMWAIHAECVEEGAVPVVPAPVLAEAWRGGPRQAGLVRLLASCVVEEMTDEQARRVGIMVGRSKHNDIVDVTVVEGAIRRGDLVVTSNRSHIAKIADGARHRVLIEDI